MPVGKGVGESDERNDGCDLLDRGEIFRLAPCSYLSGFRCEADRLRVFPIPESWGLSPLAKDLRVLGELLLL